MGWRLGRALALPPLLVFTKNGEGIQTIFQTWLFNSRSTNHMPIELRALTWVPASRVSWYCGGSHEVVLGSLFRYPCINGASGQGIARVDRVESGSDDENYTHTRKPQTDLYPPKPITCAKSQNFARLAVHLDEFFCIGNRHQWGIEPKLDIVLARSSTSLMTVAICWITFRCLDYCSQGRHSSLFGMRFQPTAIFIWPLGEQGQKQ